MTPSAVSGWEVQESTSHQVLLSLTENLLRMGLGSVGWFLFFSLEILYLQPLWPPSDPWTWNASSWSLQRCCFILYTDLFSLPAPSHSPSHSYPCSAIRSQFKKHLAKERLPCLPSAAGSHSTVLALHYTSYQLSSVAQSCPALCDPTDASHACG